MDNQHPKEGVHVSNGGIWHVGYGERHIIPSDGSSPQPPRKTSRRERFRYWRADKWGSLGERLTSLGSRLAERFYALARAAHGRSDRLYGFDDDA